MSCCGQKTPDRSPRPAPRATSPAPSPPQHHAAIFQYVGRTGLTVVGPVSGTTYRFPGPGSKERVDLRDRAGLLQLPVLREVS